MELQKTEVAEWFSADGVAARWDDMYDARPPDPDEDNFRLRRDYAVALVGKRVRTGGLILDLGCGAGAATAELLERGRRVIALDYAPDMLGRARERLLRRGLDPSVLLRGDAGRLPFADDTFACVLCLGVISYQEPYGPMLREIRRVLEPDGIALVTFRNTFNRIVSDPVRGAKALGRVALGRSALGGRRLGRFLRPSRVRQALERAELKCEHFDGIGLGPFTLAGRPLFDDRTSIRISRALMRELRRRGLAWTLEWSADVAMFVCRR